MRKPYLAAQYSIIYNYNSLVTFFLQRHSKFDSDASIWDKKVSYFAWLRLGFFIVALAVLYILFQYELFLGVAIASVAFFFVFGLLINRHNSLKTTRDFFKNLSTINQNEAKLAKLELQQQQDGASFSDNKHPYASDLDIFGKHSLFQLLNRAESNNGQAMLADWLKYPTAKTELLQRQESIKELKDKIDWRQEFQAKLIGSYLEEESLQKFSLWLNKNDFKKPPLLFLFLWVTPMIAVLALVLYLNSIISIYIFAVPILVHLWALRKVFNATKEATELAQLGSKLLKALKNGIQHIEDSEFETKSLQEWKKELNGASKQIKELENLLYKLQNRANIIYGIVNIFLLSDIRLMVAISRWKEQTKDKFPVWNETLANFEAINSLAGFAFANEAYKFPTFSDKEYTIKSTELGHPLIPQNESITNDFTMEGRGGIGLITGSNMAGKSTFLRTLGINMVLAYVGAPVCAKSMELSMLRIFTCMRTEDALEESTSSFYAELKRIRQLLDQTEAGGIPTFYLLDEILKGTNSADRHLGAKSLSYQLNNSNAMGLISTHDLELTALEGQIPRLTNYSFHCDIVEDKLHFDYKLRNGTCNSFNASKLMELMGIKIQPN